jgi:hypothetical protein
MSVKYIIIIALALGFISLLLWLIFSKDTTLNSESNGNKDREGPPYLTIPDKLEDGTVVYT